MSFVAPPPKHATASVHLLHEADSGWRTCLILDPRDGHWVLPGGHVEHDENPAEAALRAVRDATGLNAELMSTPGLIDPPIVSEKLVHPPAWIIEKEVMGDQRLPQPHLHVEHVYIAAATTAASSRDNSNFRWYDEEELDGIAMFEDARTRAKAVFTVVAAAIRSRPYIGSFR